MFAAPYYKGPVTDHFDGERFHNQVPTAHATPGAFLRWRLTRDVGPWRRVAAEPGPAPDPAIGGARVRVTFVNHSTVLLQTAGLNILTDPVWSERVSPVSWAGPRRHRPPGLRFEDLPPIHVVLISHNHYDHLDVPTLRRLAEAHAPQFVTPLGNGLLLQREGIVGATELDWWESTVVGDGVTVHVVPARHFSNRSVTDRDRALWGGFVIDGPGGRIYFAGDTGMGPHFAQIRERFGPVALALLPIGAYRPRWFMQRVHTNPDEAVEAHQILEARQSVAIHFGTFPLGDDGQDEPVADLKKALEARKVAPERFRALEHGVPFDLP